MPARSARLLLLLMMMMARGALLLLSSAVMIRRTAAHGAVTIPPPRERVDGDTAPWNGDVPWPIPFDKPNWCAHPSAERAGKDKRNLTFYCLACRFLHP